MTTASPATTLDVRGPRTARLVRLAQHPAVWLPVGVVGVGAVASLTAQREPLTVVPALDGTEATRLIAGPDVAEPAKVLVVTTFNVDAYVYDALRAGARTAED